MPMLKRIVGPNEKLISPISQRVKRFLLQHDDPAIQEEFLKFKSDIMDKILELLNEQQKGVRISQDSEFIYSIDFNQEEIKIDSRVDFSQEIRIKINSIIEANTLFSCGFFVRAREDEIISKHAFLIKKNPDGNFLLIDPHGKIFGGPTSIFSRGQYNFLKKIFNIPQQRDFEESSCPFQGSYNTCFLWSTLFFMYSDKTSEEIYTMLGNTAKVFSENIRNSNYVNDLILLLIFDKFLIEGFATDAEITAYTPKQLTGLGKCRKCGLPKA
jgi:hypothetical protein